jgi:hypothetical protein
MSHRFSSCGPKSKARTVCTPSVVGCVGHPDLRVHTDRLDSVGILCDESLAYRSIRVYVSLGIAWTSAHYAQVSEAPGKAM